MQSLSSVKNGFDSAQEDSSMIFFQNGLKYNNNSAWKHSLQKLRDIFETRKGFDCRERTGPDELKGNADGDHWKEKLGGWWW